MRPNISRRSYLAGATATSIFGVAGCLSDEDVETINIATPGSGTVSHETVTALQRALDMETEEVRIRVEETSGDPESIQLFDDGEFDGHTAGLTIMVAALNEAEPFDTDPVDELAMQALNMATLHHYWVAVDGSGIETFDDIVEMDDIGVFILPPGWGLRRLKESVLESAGVLGDLEDKVVNTEVGEVAGAMDEGRIDAAVIYGSNFQSNAGWVTEIDARVDVHTVEGTDTLRSGIEGADETVPMEFEPYGWDQDVGADEVLGWPELFYILAGDGVSDEAVYEMCRVSHEHNDVVQEAGDTYLDHTDIDTMADGLTDQLDIHPGARDFYEEYGADLP